MKTDGFSLCPPWLAARPPRTAQRVARRGSGICAAALMALALGGCGSPYVGVSVPVGPGSVRVGASNGGVTAGASARVGPVGVGVGVNQRG
ncbi:MAG: hypothetical protein LBP52_07870, partial [Burkholderiaceae bacterium]|nr:hypothetical protein [Burkholderiaceae bacterium]